MTSSYGCAERQFPHAHLESGVPREPARVSRIAKLVVLALVELGIARWIGARSAVSSGVVSERARKAALAFRYAAEKPSTDLAEAFAAFVAGCLDCPVRTVIGPDLPTRLLDAGVSPDLASRAGDLLDVLVASRYGGRVDEERIQHACELVDALAVNFREHEVSRATQA